MLSTATLHRPNVSSCHHDACCAAYSGAHVTQRHTVVCNTRARCAYYACHDLDVYPQLYIHKAANTLEVLTCTHGCTHTGIQTHQKSLLLTQVLLTQDPGTCSVSETLVDVLAYLGSDLDAEKHDDPQGYSIVGLVTLPVTTAMPLLLDYMEESTILHGDASKLAYFDEHALEPCVECFSHIVTGLLAQNADSRNQTLISMLRPGGPSSKPILLMLGKQCSASFNLSTYSQPLCTAAFGKAQSSRTHANCGAFQFNCPCCITCSYSHRQAGTASWKARAS